MRGESPRHMECGRIETIAGGGPVGDGGPAVAARLSLPGGVLLSPQGDLLIVDFGNHRVRRVDGRGVITTICGTGQPGFSGDGGPAHLAQLARPENAAFDPGGNLYIVDSHNHRIRRIDARSGVITTVVGTGEPGFAGDGGPAASARLYQPEGIAFDRDGNYYIGDTLNGRVRRVDAKSGTITTVAGNGRIGTSPDGTSALETSFLRLARLAVGPDGDVYIADSPAQTIQKIDLRAATVRLVAGTGQDGHSGDGGPARAARLSYPEGLAFDRDGNLYFGDLGGHCVRRIDAKSGVITTIAGTGVKGFEGDEGPARAARLWSPGRIAVDAAGNVFVADIDNARIRRIDRAGIITTVAGSGRLGDGGPAAASSLAIPGDLAFRDGRLYIAEFGNRRVRRIDVGRGEIVTIAGGGSDGEIAAATGAELKLPESIAVDDEGNLFIADSLGHSVWRVDAETRAIARYAGTGREGRGRDGVSAVHSAMTMPGALALAGDGRLFVSDFGNRRIRAVERDGTIATVIEAQAVSLDWNAGTLYWLESGDKNLYSLDGDGKRRAWPVAFQLSDLAVAPPFVYLAATLAHRVLRLDLRSGEVITVAGNGRQGFAGDDGPAAAASLFRPGALAVGDGGELYIADTFNHRVRVVETSCDAKAPDPRIVSYRLGNGFGVVVAVEPELKLTAVNLHIAGGALTDPPGRRGMAHLIEHASVPDSYEQLMESLGAVGMNAVTSLDATQYLCRLPPAAIGTWMEQEAGRVRTPLFQDFERERERVLQEVDTGDEEIAAITPAEALAHYRAACSPERMAVAVVGNVDPEEIRRLAEKMFGTLPRVALTAPWPRSVRSAVMHDAPRGSRRAAALDAMPGAQRLDSHVLVDPAADATEASILHARLAFHNELADPTSLAALLAFEEATRGDWRAVVRHAWHLDALSSSPPPVARLSAHAVARTTRPGDPAGAFVIVRGGAAVDRVKDEFARNGATVEVAAGRELTVIRMDVLEERLAPALEALKRGLVQAETASDDIWTAANEELTEMLWERRRPAGWSAGGLAGGPVIAVWTAHPERVSMERGRPARQPPGVSPGGFAARTAARDEPRLAGGTPALHCLPSAVDPPMLLVGVPIEADNDDTFFAAQAAAHILGRRLRAAQPKVYTIEATVIPVSRSALTLRITAQTTDVAGVYEAVQTELQRLRSAPPSEDELEIARRVLASRVDIDADSPRAALYDRALELAGAGNGRRDRAAEAIARLTPAKVRLDVTRTGAIVVTARANPLCGRRVAAGGER